MFTNIGSFEFDEREFSPEEEESEDDDDEPDQTCPVTKVYIEKEMKSSIIGRNGRNIKQVQKIAKTHVKYFTPSLSVISILPKRNHSLQDALSILQGMYLNVIIMYV